MSLADILELLNRKSETCNYLHTGICTDTIKMCQYIYINIYIYISVRTRVQKDFFRESLKTMSSDFPKCSEKAEVK
jgi:hypothetical protein